MRLRSADKVSVNLKTGRCSVFNLDGSVAPLATIKVITVYFPGLGVSLQEYAIIRKPIHFAVADDIVPVLFVRGSGRINSALVGTKIYNRQLAVANLVKTVTVGNTLVGGAKKYMSLQGAIGTFNVQVRQPVIGCIVNELNGWLTLTVTGNF